MATKRTNLYLYLAIACFVAIIAIFVVDGYMGVYDTVYITSGEQEQRIEPDFWLGQGPLPNIAYKGVDWGEKILFRYEVDNHQFSRYSASLEVSVWRMEEKVLDVTSQPMVVAPFGKAEVEWVVDTAKIIPGGIPSERGEEFSVIIKRGEIERRIIVNLHPVISLPKVVPAG
jgi:hypothetical protein